MGRICFIWNRVQQGKGKGALWPVSPFLLVSLHKAASPEEQGPGVGGLHQPPMQDGLSFFVGALRKEGFVRCRVARSLGLHF